MAIDDSSMARPGIGGSRAETGGYDLAAELGLSAGEVAELNQIPPRTAVTVPGVWQGGGGSIDLTGEHDGHGGVEGRARSIRITPDQSGSTAWAVPHLGLYSNLGLGQGKGKGVGGGVV